MRAIEWLSNKKILNLDYEPYDEYYLDSNGIKYSKEGLPEVRILDFIKKNKLVFQEDLLKKFSKDEFSATIGILRRFQCINMNKTDNGLEIKYLKDLPHTIENDFLIKNKDNFPFSSNEIKEEIKYAIDSLLKRKNILKKVSKNNKKITISKEGIELLKQDIEHISLIDKITPDLIEEIKINPNKELTFRRYDINSKVPEFLTPKSHIIDQLLDYFRSIWVGMGFEEMKGDIIDNSFNILDSLFVPQDHPARTLQDTFYVGENDVIFHKNIDNKDLVKRIKEMHEAGIADNKKISKGWEYLWKEEESSKVMLRSHTTVLSALKIHETKGKDGKYFSLGRNFRNEAVDWKHGFQFFQVEGIVVHPDANMKNLVWFLKEFFKKLGFDKIRLRPSYFPYTEPSVEIDVYNDKRKEWVELGGSGIFRPEVTYALTGKYVPVLAWGMGFDRFAMSLFGIEDLRDLYSKDLDTLRRYNLLRK